MQNEVVNLATLFQEILDFLQDKSGLIVAIFTALLWWVSEKQTRIAKKQAEIADRQTQIQEALARLETEPLVFLELSYPKAEGLVPSFVVKPLILNIVNMGRYGCLVSEVAVMPPDWEPRGSPENEASEKEILVQNTPVLAGERKEVKIFDSIRQVAGQHSDWWDEFVRKRELFLKVSYYYGGKPEETRYDFFRVILSIRREHTYDIVEIEAVEIAHRSSYQA